MNTISVEVNRMDHGCDDAVVTIGFGGGFVLTGNLCGSEGAGMAANRSFYATLLRCLLQLPVCAGASPELGATVAALSFEWPCGDVPALLGALLSQIASLTVSEDSFKQAREQAIEAFRQSYKDGLFRAQLKVYEATNLSTPFKLSDLIGDYERLDYAAFLRLLQELVVPGNISVHVLGDVDAASIGEAVQGLPTDFMARPNPVWEVRDVDPYLTEDAHVANIGRANASVNVLAIYFEDFALAPHEKRLIADMLSASPEFPPCWVAAGPFDTSITVAQDEPVSLRPLAQLPDDEQSFDSYRANLVGRHALLAREEPYQFGIAAIESHVAGLELGPYLAYLKACSFEEYRRVSAAADPIVREAQVVIKGVGDRG